MKRKPTVTLTSEACRLKFGFEQASRPTLSRFHFPTLPSTLSWVNERSVRDWTVLSLP